MMHIVEIFSSIEGEGIRSGKMVTFIRVAGCNCRCSYCDTKYSYNLSEATEMSVDEVITKVNELGNNLITVTGGEPLIHEDITILLSRLTLAGYHVNVETNGSVDIRPFKKVTMDYPISQDKIMFTVDWKSPSSGMNEMMNHYNLFACGYKDVIKFVVGSQADMEHMLYILENNKFTCPNIYISPVFGDIEMTEIVRFMQDHNLYQCTLQVQLHKIIWDPEMRGV